MFSIWHMVIKSWLTRITSLMQHTYVSSLGNFSSETGEICHTSLGFWRSTGVGAGKFLGERRIFAQISPNLPKKFSLHLLPTNFLPQRTWIPVIGVTSKKGLNCIFLQKLGAIFAQSFRDFTQIFRSFAQIFNKSKLLGVCLHTRHLHHCEEARFREFQYIMHRCLEQTTQYLDLLLMLLTRCNSCIEDHWNRHHSCRQSFFVPVRTCMPLSALPNPVVQRSHQCLPGKCAWAQKLINSARTVE